MDQRSLDITVRSRCCSPFGPLAWFRIRFPRPAYDAPTIATMSLPVLHPRMTALLASAIHTTNTIVISALVLVITIIIYRLVFHPLAGIPGPKLAAVSNIWHAYHVKNGRMVHLGKTLHRQYGPVVRVGPNEVWFNSKEACQTIYGKVLLPPCLNVTYTILRHKQWLREVRLLS